VPALAVVFATTGAVAISLRASFTGTRLAVSTRGFSGIVTRYAFIIATTPTAASVQTRENIAVDLMESTVSP